MRHQSATFLKKFLDANPSVKSILEVGSGNVNGTVRGVVPSEISYLGVDMTPGDGVDQVVNGHDLVKHFGRKRFDAVICFDTFEHDNKFWITYEQMRKLAKKGGWIVLGAPGRNCPLHMHPSDYWRFMKPSFEEIFFDGLINVCIEEQTDDEGHPAPDELYGYGQKV